MGAGDTSEMSVGERLDRLDALKGVAIVAVVAIHALATGVVDLDRRPVAALGGVLTASVPVFMAAAVWAAVRERAADPKAITRRLRRLPVPYVVATVFYVLLAHAAGGPDLAKLAHEPAWSVASFGGGWYHLYFLPALAQVLVLIPVLTRVVATRRGALIALVVAAVAFATGPFATGRAADVLDLRWAVVWVGPALVGAAIALGTVRIRRAGLWFIGGLVILAVEAIVAAERGTGGATAYARVGALLATAGALASACRPGHAPRWLVELGRRSLGVYLVHPAVLLGIAVLRHRTPYSAAAVPLVTALATAVAWALTVALESTPAAPVVGGRQGGRRRVAVEHNDVRVSVEPVIRPDECHS